MFPLTPWAEPRSSFVQPVEPPSVDPDEGGLISLTFNPAWLPYVLGALMQLTQRTTWAGDEDAKTLAVGRATNLINLVGYPLAAIPGTPPSTGPVLIRYNPTTHTTQFSPDGGTTWIESPGSDPRTASPLPPQTGSGAQCNSAASARKYLTRFHGVLSITGNTGVTATGLAYSIIALMTELTGPWGILLDVFVAASLGFISAGLTAIDLAFDDANLDLFECLLYCALNANNQIDSAGLSSIESAITAQIGGTDATILNAALSLWGVGGVNSAMALKLDTDDCSGCDCNWCYNFNFVAANQGWAATSGSYVSGTGFRSSTSGPSTILSASISFTATRVTGLRFRGTAGHASNGGTRVVRLYLAGSIVYTGTISSATGAIDNSFSMSFMADSIQIQFDTFNFSNANVATQVTASGTGDNPFGADNC